MPTTTELPALDAGYFVGLDLGQADDYTALAVVHRLDARADAEQNLRPARGLGLPGSRFRVVHLERLRRVPYPAIVKRVAGLLDRPEIAKGPHRPSPDLVVDATGVGRPVVDLFRVEGLQPIAVTITGGDVVGSGQGTITVPKRDLVGALLVLLQQGRLRIQGSLKHAATLEQELTNFRVKINTRTAHDSYNAREGEHDDLLLAAALACWQAARADRIVGGWPVIQR